MRESAVVLTMRRLRKKLEEKLGQPVPSQIGEGGFFYWSIDGAPQTMSDPFAFGLVFALSHSLCGFSFQAIDLSLRA